MTRKRTGGRKVRSASASPPAVSDTGGTIVVSTRGGTVTLDEYINAHLHDLAKTNALPRTLAAFSDAYLNPPSFPGDEERDIVLRRQTAEKSAKTLNLERLERAEALLSKVARREDAEHVQKFRELVELVRRHKLGFIGYMEYLKGLAAEDRKEES